MKISIFLVLFACVGCAKECIVNTCQESPRKEITCITLYDPVCGCNNKTYGNECEASASGISIFTKGACK